MKVMLDNVSGHQTIGANDNLRASHSLQLLSLHMEVASILVLNQDGGIKIYK